MKFYKNLVCGTCLLVLWLVINIQGTVTSSQDFSSDISKLTFIGESVYVGGSDAVYKLHKLDLNVVNSIPINTPPPPCDGSCPQPLANPEVTYLGQLNDTDFLLCSSAYGQCELHKLSDLTRSSTSKALITSNREYGTVVATIAPFSQTLPDTIWIASSNYTSQSGEKSFAISARKFDFGFSYLKESGVFDPTIKFSAQPYITTAPEIEVKYVHAFSYNKIRFFVKRRSTSSTIAGICENDEIFTTLIELKLSCDGKTDIMSAYTAKPGSQLNIISSELVTTSDLVLFAVFGTAESSTLCAFSVKRVIRELDITFRKCHHDNNQDVSVGPQEFIKDTKSCSVLTSVTTSFYCK